jgi:tetrahydromethanopterin S-methyltransferase subunit B
LETKSGRQLAPYMIQEPQDYEVTFTAVEVEEQVSRIEQEIDDLQDNLDQFNSTSQIEIPD